MRRRPRPEVWSALEYGCHVRDVLLVQRYRVPLVRREDDPAPPPMGRDERVLHDGYAEQRPAEVARQLVDVASLFARISIGSTERRGNAASSTAIRRRLGAAPSSGWPYTPSTSCATICRMPERRQPVSVSTHG